MTGIEDGRERGQRGMPIEDAAAPEADPNDQLIGLEMHLLVADKRRVTAFQDRHPMENLGHRRGRAYDKCSSSSAPSSAKCGRYSNSTSSLNSDGSIQPE